MRVVMNGKLPLPEDVQNILCGPEGWIDQGAAIGSAARRVAFMFVGMVDDILSRKEADERAVEREMAATWEG